MSKYKIDLQEEGVETDPEVLAEQERQEAVVAEEERTQQITSSYRIPCHLYEWLRRQAFERRVSINSLVIEALEAMREVAA